MIRLGIVIKKNRIFTDYSDRDITLNEASLLIYELEKIKQEVLKKKFKLDLRIDDEHRNKK